MWLPLPPFCQYHRLSAHPESGAIGGGGGGDDCKYFKRWSGPRGDLTDQNI